MLLVPTDPPSSSSPSLSICRTPLMSQQASLQSLGPAPLIIAVGGGGGNLKEESKYSFPFFNLAALLDAFPR